jgi:hypothetical protein
MTLQIRLLGCPHVIQDVHKVSLQFQKFITKANGDTDKWKLLQNETYIFKFFASFNRLKTEYLIVNI